MRNSVCWKVALAVGITLGLTSIPASAALIQVFSNDLASWSAAAGSPVVVEDFSDTTLVSGLSLDSPQGSGVISNGVYTDVAYLNPALNTVVGFASPVTAFGGNWDLSYNAPGTGIALFLSFIDGTTLTLGTEIPNTFAGEFFGFTSDLAVQSIRLDSGTQGGSMESFIADDFRFVAEHAQSVPEPGSLSLLAVGVVGFSFCQRRRSRVRSARRDRR